MRQATCRPNWGRCHVSALPLWASRQPVCSTVPALAERLIADEECNPPLAGHVHPVLRGTRKTAEKITAATHPSAPPLPPPRARLRVPHTRTTIVGSAPQICASTAAYLQQTQNPGHVISMDAGPSPNLISSRCGSGNTPCNVCLQARGRGPSQQSHTQQHLFTCRQCPCDQ